MASILAMPEAVGFIMESFLGTGGSGMAAPMDGKTRIVAIMTAENPR